MQYLLKALTLSLTASTAMAGGDALVIGNASYDRLQTLFGSARLTTGAEALRDNGVNVTHVADADGTSIDAAFARFFDGIVPGDGPVIVALSGAFMHGPAGAYLLPVNARRTPDVARVLTTAFPVDAALTVLARYPGRAFLLIGENADNVGTEAYLAGGPGSIALPQGVTLVQGAAVDLARFAARLPGNADVPLADLADRFDLTLAGYQPEGHVMLREADLTPRDVPNGEGDGTDSAAVDGEDRLPTRDLARDAAAWRAAQDGDSLQSYANYLESFPNGVNAGAARQRMSAIEAEPYYAERRAEEALDLSRDARRAIQSNLALLGYYDRGIDGLFGRGTRAAIAAFQRAINRPATGYLSESQIRRLDGLARERAAQLEAEAAAQRAERERQDRAYWADVDTSDRGSLRSYLERYPEGAFAERARERLEVLDGRAAERAQRQDRRDWERAVEAGTRAAFVRYLEQRPDGVFADQARDRIRALDRAAQNEQAIAQAQAQERALGLNPVARRLAEARLQTLGLNPGEIDGTFDEATRIAIARYQRERGLKTTGFLDQATVVRLMADGILGR